MFADPLVSILPRLFIGIVAYLVYASTIRINGILAAVLAGALGSATNTVLEFTPGSMVPYTKGNGLTETCTYATYTKTDSTVKSGLWNK